MIFESFYEELLLGISPLLGPRGFKNRSRTAHFYCAKNDIIQNWLARDDVPHAATSLQAQTTETLLWEVQVNTVGEPSSSFHMWCIPHAHVLPAELLSETVTNQRQQQDSIWWLPSNCWEILYRNIENRSMYDSLCVETTQNYAWH